MQPPLRLWQRLSTRMVAAFVLVTFFAIGLAAFVMLYGLAHVPLLGRLDAVHDQLAQPPEARTGRVVTAGATESAADLTT